MNDTMHANDTIVVEIYIAAPPERVFEAWTDPQQRLAWWGDDAAYRGTKMDSDLRVGGKWRTEGKRTSRSPTPDSSARPIATRTRTDGGACLAGCTPTCSRARGERAVQCARAFPRRRSWVFCARPRRERRSWTCAGTTASAARPFARGRRNTAQRSTPKPIG